MRLQDLEPKFLKYINGTTHRQHDDFAEADGVMFLCPKCFAEKGDSIGVHSVICWQPHVPRRLQPGPGRWTFLGTSYDDLTLRAGSSSVALMAGCMAHFFVEDGKIRMC